MNKNNSPPTFTIDDLFLIEEGLGRLNVDHLNPTERINFLALLEKVSRCIEHFMQENKHVSD